MNIANILKDKPQGTKLYSSLCGELTLDKVDPNGIYCKTDNNNNTAFMEDGSSKAYGCWLATGECLLFPSKKMRDWKKLSWKKGDVLVGKNGDTVIFTEWVNDSYTQFKGLYCCQACDVSRFHDKEEGLNTFYFSKASKEQRKLYLGNLKLYYGGELNLKTLEIENQPKFKDGDFVYVETTDGDKIIAIFRKFIGNKELTVYVDFFLSDKEPMPVNNDGYNILCKSGEIAKMRLATDSEKQILFSKLVNIGKKWNPDTKQIEEDLPKPCEFKPFDRVLVRDTNIDKWEANLFSNYKEDKNGYHYVCVYGEWKQCVPYGGNEHLLDTRDSPKIEVSNEHR